MALNPHTDEKMTAITSDLPTPSRFIKDEGLSMPAVTGGGFTGFILGTSNPFDESFSAAANFDSNSVDIAERPKATPEPTPEPSYEGSVTPPPEPQRMIREARTEATLIAETPYNAVAYDFLDQSPATSEQNSDDSDGGAKGVGSKAQTSAAKKPRKYVPKKTSRKRARYDTPPSDDDDDDAGLDPEAKRKKFLERNRIAALRCRQRKKVIATTLETSFAEANKRNVELVRRAAELREELLKLQRRAMLHSTCGCDIKEYTVRKAEEERRAAEVLFDV
ncbi:hypothetical protein M427DRAFT_62614 [Gonapodya prolifera JEL478]|uniref:BZIP domain-containing protein n=1 Tax=Gonapodya prolifera (strain JEL478) TaxID=1344416 RepID=A0A139A0A8_GONPJ|nr:hypothetical protein M427DRAFT_62614 [Gonapodya prolifera JEL478]|eukprot:KXS10200.1 hypothetical protein M427DRAFT_62614 [Gonapodya prolifera JEL478]